MDFSSLLSYQNEAAGPEKGRGQSKSRKVGLDKLEKAFARTMLLISQLWMQKYGRK